MKKPPSISQCFFAFYGCVRINHLEEMGKFPEKDAFKENETFTLWGIELMSS
jgi:hypothetical protein